MIAGETIPSNRLTNLSGSTWQAVYEVKSGILDRKLQYFVFRSGRKSRKSGEWSNISITINTEALPGGGEYLFDNPDNQTVRLDDLVILKFRSSESIQRLKSFFMGQRVGCHDRWSQLATDYLLPVQVIRVSRVWISILRIMQATREHGLTRQQITPQWRLTP